MNKRDLKKITKKVLEHWEDNVETASDGFFIKRDPSSCSYCENFRKADSSFMMCCSGCPVFEDTGLNGCLNTPYKDTKTGFESILATTWMEYLYLLNVAYSQELI